MGIWEYQEYLAPKVDKPFQLSSNEGDTPTKSSHVLATMLGLERLYMKREDNNPSGSHKDRMIAFEISAHMQDGVKDIVISSSGNTAISAMLYCKYLNNLNLHLFLSVNLPEDKITRIEHALEANINVPRTEQVITYDNFHLHFSHRPVSGAFKFAKENNFVLLRGSTDPYAIEGYKTIAFELIKQIPQVSEIFLPVSSGTTALGIYEGFKIVNEKMGLNIKIPEIHIVQTSRVNPMAREFDKDFTKSASSIAKSIVDRVGHRKKEVVDIVRASNGFGWVISDQELQYAQRLLKFANVSTSIESAMTIAAIKKALATRRRLKFPVCIFTGTN
ncbi:MAG: hypothetical protein Fur003_6490 [Candidatus Dojkabacteria bacterium]